MSLFRRIIPHLWMVALAGACVFLYWTYQRRTERVVYISQLAGKSEMKVDESGASLSGYAGGLRKLVIPERNEDSFHWISQTQQMLASGDLRIRHVAYDNAPQGRPVLNTSPYRWWVAAVAWGRHQVSGRPLGLCVEEAALMADPLLFGLFVVAATILVSLRSGPLGTSLFALGTVLLFPLGACCLPGAPTDQGMAFTGALLGLLLFWGGFGRQTRRGVWFAVAGIVGGLALWVSVTVAVPLVAGIAIGGLCSSWVSRKTETSAPWLLWSLCGGVTVMIAYLVEYAPDSLGGWRLEHVHPLYGLSWIGLGLLADRIEKWQRGHRWCLGDLGFVICGALALLALPVAMKFTETQGFLTASLNLFRLSNLPGGVVASSFHEWSARDGALGSVLCVLSPLVVLIPALWLFFAKGRSDSYRSHLVLLGAPFIVSLGFAFWRLSWWSLVDVCALLVLVVCVEQATAMPKKLSQLLWPALLVALAVPGFLQLRPGHASGDQVVLTHDEAKQIVERDLAHWLSLHATEDSPIVYTAPLESTTLSYFGALRGIGTFDPDNKDGFGATLQIASMNTMGEAQAMIEGRGIRYIVIPSWDRFFEEFAQLYLGRDRAGHGSLLISELRVGNLPLWVRPLAYQMPALKGFEKDSVFVFEVVEEQSPAAALSRHLEYWIEMGDPSKAVILDGALKRFPGDVGALAAHAQLQNAAGDAFGASQTLNVILSRIANGGDKYLPWDRRLSLAVVLANGQREEQSRRQLQRCLSEIDERKLKELSPGALFNLLVLTQALGMPIENPRLRSLALDLLPKELRANL